MKKTPATDQAYAFIKSQMAANKWPSGSRLPSCQTLASQADVSFVTMHAVLATLKKQKLLSSIQGSGTFVGPMPPEKRLMHKVPPKTTRSQDIYEKLRADIFEGAYGVSGFLPLQKELSERYATGFHTLNAALTRLQKENILKVDKRRLKIVALAPRSSYSSIHLIMGETVLHHNLFTYEQTWFDEFVRSLERESCSRNIRVVKSYMSEKTLAIVPGDNCLGYVLWHSIDNPITDVVRLATTLSYKKPVVVFCMYMSQDHETLSTLCKDRLVFITNDDLNQQSGLCMGRFLIGKGFKKTFYFAYQPEKQWSIDRYTGLCNAFETAGYTNAVTLMHPQKGSAYVSTSVDKQMFQAIDLERDILVSNLKNLSTIESQPHHLNERFNFHIIERENGLAMQKEFTPIFRNALSQGPEWAWACADDYIALFAAMEFLKSEPDAIRKKVAIIGCNDHLESSLHNLTTCHFNFESSARRALSLILYPQSRKGKNKGGIFSIDMNIIDRGSA